MRQYADARFALTVAYGQTPSVIGWKAGGWVVYDPVVGAPEGVEPEMLVTRLGLMPIPLSEAGALVLQSAILREISC